MIYIIQTSDEIAGIDIADAFLKSGISLFTIVSKQRELPPDQSSKTNTVTVRTPEENFSSAFKYALDQGIITFGMVDSAGWQDDCNCASCRSQRIIFEYLWPAENPPNNGVVPTAEAGHSTQD